MKRKYSIIICVFLLWSCSKRHVDFLIQAPEESTAPAKFTFENTSNNFDSYFWDFGDGFSSNDSSTVHTYFLSGKYIVRLKGIKGNKSKESVKELIVSAPTKCLVQIETEYGNMLVELFDSTPKHRDNFLKLAESGYYDDVLFHRVIKGFMIQGGDPRSKNAASSTPLGSGGPGYTIEAEFDENLAHIKGALAAARTGDNVNPQRRSSGSQFYLVDGKPVTALQLNQIEGKLGLVYPEAIKEKYIETGGTPFLDQNYTVFGQVIDGIEVIDVIANVQTGQGDRPVNDIKMKIRVIK